MIGIAAAWILILLVGGGIALDRVASAFMRASFDEQLEFTLNSLIASADINRRGELVLNRELGDQRYFEPGSGSYWQITGPGLWRIPSRSLWDQRLILLPWNRGINLRFYNSRELDDENLRVVERVVRLPHSPYFWRFQVAQNRSSVDAQVRVLRQTLLRSFALLGIGLIGMAALQTLYGLWPLRELRRDLATMRSGAVKRIERQSLPDEVAPLVDELNGLLDHNERQAEDARRHAGNLAHALKTPLTVIVNAAHAGAPDLERIVLRETATMRRQIDHQLARARALGRRGENRSRCSVQESLLAVERAVSTLYPHARLDHEGDLTALVRVERQDLDEILGNLIENAAKYGNGTVFSTVRQKGDRVEILVEDDGPGIAERDRQHLFSRGARLDTQKPGTGLGLSIVRDVAELYGGTVVLDESEDLGGLMVRLNLAAATTNPA